MLLLLVGGINYHYSARQTLIDGGGPKFPRKKVSRKQKSSVSYEKCKYFLSRSLLLVWANSRTKPPESTNLLKVGGGGWGQMNE